LYALFFPFFSFPSPALGGRGLLWLTCLLSFSIHIVGYGLPMSNGLSMGATLGSVYVNQLLDRLTNSTGNATNMYLE
jgi:hypothetical protein